jgi:DNA-binding CsgD family transcriptional regulator
MIDLLVDLEAVVTDLKLSRLILHADNFTCYTAMQFAAKYPDKVAALILVNPSPQHGGPLMEAWRELYLNAWPLFLETWVSVGTPGGEAMRDITRNAVTHEDFLNIAAGGIGYYQEDLVPLVTVPTLVLASRSYLNPKYVTNATEIASGVVNGRITFFDGTKNADFMTSSDGSEPQAIPVMDEFLREVLAREPRQSSSRASRAKPSLGTETMPHLSPRQAEVLKLMALGKTNREIAESLVLSERTVQRHISDIFLKLDVRNRVEASAFATNA